MFKALNKCKLKVSQPLVHSLVRNTKFYHQGNCFLSNLKSSVLTSLPKEQCMISKHCPTFFDWSVSFTQSRYLYETKNFVSRSSVVMSLNFSFCLLQQLKCINLYILHAELTHKLNKINADSNKTSRIVIFVKKLFLK